jgi:hypothetical protein
MPGSLTTPRGTGARVDALPCCLPLFAQLRLLRLSYFRGSMAGLCAPLPTLHCRPRTARGQYGSLLLRSGLAPPTPCRSPAHAKRYQATLKELRVTKTDHIKHPHGGTQDDVRLAFARPSIAALGPKLLRI